MSRGDAVLTLTLSVASLMETQEIAIFFAQKLKRGHIMTLRGPLGVGKSAFARAFIQHLTSPEEEVPSPTFTLVQTYQTSMCEVWHFDLYRLSQPEELWELGFEEAPGVAISLIEWPERIDALGVLANALSLTLALGAAEGARVLHFQGSLSWNALLGDAQKRFGGILGSL